MPPEEWEETQGDDNKSNKLNDLYRELDQADNSGILESPVAGFRGRDRAVSQSPHPYTPERAGYGAATPGGFRRPSRFHDRYGEDSMDYDYEYGVFFFLHVRHAHHIPRYYSTELRAFFIF